MANTPQAKKRIRRNANRATVNHSRISRIRTFIKQVESAIASGKKADAAEALKAVQPEIARGVARGVIHKNTAAAQNFAAFQAGCVARLNFASTTFLQGPSGNRRPFSFWDWSRKFSNSGDLRESLTPS